MNPDVYYEETERAARIAVRRGAELLDDYRPGWWADIDLPTLDLTDCNRCVLGQLFADPGITSSPYSRGLDVLAELFEDRQIWSASYWFGFDSGPTGDSMNPVDVDYDDLGVAWAELIVARRQAAALALVGVSR